MKKSKFCLLHVCCLCCLLAVQAVNALFAQSLQDGSSCENAIPIDANYTASIPAAGVVWYRVWTYDLPIALYFQPTSPNSTQRPLFELDFTCTPRVYSTEELQTLFGSNGSIVMPHTVILDLTQANGRNDYLATVPKNFREMMMQIGITEDVEAFLKVTYPEAGNISMNPDFSFANCVRDADMAALDDTIRITDPEAVDYYVFPFPLWQKDSIRFVWTGEEPLAVWFGKDCNFLPDPGNDHFLEYIEIYPEDSPYYKFTQADVRSFISTYSQEVPEGLFYVRFTSDGPGDFVVEKVPLQEASATAIPLVIDGTVAVPDSNQLYYFPKTWTSAVKFTTPTNHLMEAYFGTKDDFHLTNAVDSVRFVVTVDSMGRLLGLDADKLSKLTTAATSASSDYVYVRFVCDKATTVSVSLWENGCAYGASEAKMNIKTTYTSREQAIYRVLYSDISGYDLKVTWNPATSRTGSFTLAATCNYSDMSKAAYKLWSNTSIARNGSATIKAATLNNWASRVDEDGYIYLGVYAAVGGTFTLTTSKPADAGFEDPEPEVIDPIYPPTPEPEWTGTIRLACEEENVMRVEVSVEQTLSLYEARDHTSTTPRPLTTLIEQWTQAPADPPHTITLESGKTYLLVGASDRIYIRR